jgi:hypothetical protein
MGGRNSPNGNCGIFSWSLHLDVSRPDRCRGTDNFGAGVNSRESTMRYFNAAAVVTTYL